MPEGLIQGSRLHEVILEKVKHSIEKRNIGVTDTTEFYIVNLLNNFNNPSVVVSFEEVTMTEKPISILLLEALGKSLEERLNLLKKIGDSTLIVCGFFGDRLRKGIVSPSYYETIGQTAYGNLASLYGNDKIYYGLFDELAKKFVMFTEVLADVAPWNQAKTDLEILKLYERWIASGDDRLKEELEKKGICK